MICTFVLNFITIIFLHHVHPIMHAAMKGRVATYMVNKGRGRARACIVYIKGERTYMYNTTVKYCFTTGK